MEEQLFKTLQKLKTIKPDPAFVERTRRFILSSPRKGHPAVYALNRFFDTLKFGAALSLASAMMFLVLGGFSYFKVTSISPLVLTSFESDSLEQEAQGLDFRIQLGQAKYFDEATQQVAESEKEISMLLERIAL